MMKLSDAKVRKAASGEKDYKLPDGHGLYLLVTTRGTKLWRLKYRFARKEKLLALGSYPTISLLEAREQREAARKMLREGVDPSVEKKRRVLTAQVAAASDFETLARQWFDLQKSRWVPVHAADVINSLERDVFPSIGGLPVAAIDPPIVLETLRAIEKRGAIETAKRVRQRISAVFVYAISEGRATNDPAAIVTKALRPMPAKQRQPAITDLDELRAMLRAVEASGASPVTLLASRLLSLTAVRPGVLRGAEWAEFEGIWPDAESEPMWRVPAGRMKLTLERKDDEAFDHLVPLPHQAIDVLRMTWELPNGGGNISTNPEPEGRIMQKNSKSETPADGAGGVNAGHPWTEWVDHAEALETILDHVEATIGAANDLGILEGLRIDPEQERAFVSTRWLLHLASMRLAERGVIDEPSLSECLARASRQTGKADADHPWREWGSRATNLELIVAHVGALLDAVDEMGIVHELPIDPEGRRKAHNAGWMLHLARKRLADSLAIPGCDLSTSLFAMGSRERQAA
ncbi:MAG: integrase arm-type DNA-binding domain-containing protein [Sphingomonadaceae bacterium]